MLQRCSILCSSYFVKFARNKRPSTCSVYSNKNNTKKSLFEAPLELLGNLDEVHQPVVVLGVEAGQGARVGALDLRDFQGDVHDVVEVVVVVLQW